MVFTNSKTDNKKIQNYTLTMLAMDEQLCAFDHVCNIKQHSNYLMPTNIEVFCEDSYLKIVISQPQNNKYILSALLDIQFTSALL